jgi:hypothetical protein
MVQILLKNVDSVADEKKGFSWKGSVCGQQKGRFFWSKRRFEVVLLPTASVAR